MKVPMSVTDFLDRAVRAYGSRTAVVDEPDQPESQIAMLENAIGDQPPQIAGAIHQHAPQADALAPSLA